MKYCVDSDDEQGLFQTQTHEILTVTPHANVENVSKNQKSTYGKIKNITQKHKLGLITCKTPQIYTLNKNTKNTPQQPKGKTIKIGTLTFSSNFDSGYLDNAEIIGTNHYKITLGKQWNSMRDNAWFYFGVEGGRGEMKIVVGPFRKGKNLYREGMRVCVREGEGEWKRGGYNIRYQDQEGGEQGQIGYWLKYNYNFRTHENTHSKVDEPIHNKVYFAYSFPYTYNHLTTFLTTIPTTIHHQTLCNSFQGHKIPLLTLGNLNSPSLIVITARVHPGQTGSSYIIQAFIRHLLEQNQYSKYLREKFMIKIVPMINVDGVQRGNYRFSGNGVDLNRKWKKPHHQQQPQIYHLKQMILKSQKQLKMYIDLHGHGRKKNVFFYGCSNNRNPTQARAFPYLMSKIDNAFSFKDCTFNVQKQKEGTARVTLWRQFQIDEIFTMETSFCGVENSKNVNFLIKDYQNIGRKLCEGISVYFQPEDVNEFKGKVLKQLSADSQLLKVGEQECSGSDSEPEKGQKEEEKVVATSKPQLMSKRHRTLMSAHRNFAKTAQKLPSTTKQKSQTRITQTRQKSFFKQILQIPSSSQLLDVDFSPHPAKILRHRVHSTSKDYYPVEAPTFSTLNSQKLSRIENSRKKGLVKGRQGAQYRRVRKMAEQSMRNDHHGETIQVEVRGVKNSHIEMQNTRKILSVSKEDKSKAKKMTADMFYRKTMRVEQSWNQKNQIGVWCRGRQITFL